MIVERVVFQAKYGKGDELVTLFKEFAKVAPPASMGRNPRLLTDRSGLFFTIVLEAEGQNPITTPPASVTINDDAATSYGTRTQDASPVSVSTSTMAPEVPKVKSGKTLP